MKNWQGGLIGLGLYIFWFVLIRIIQGIPGLQEIPKIITTVATLGTIIPFIQLIRAIEPATQALLVLGFVIIWAAIYYAAGFMLTKLYHTKK